MKKSPNPRKRLGQLLGKTIVDKGMVDRIIGNLSEKQVREALVYQLKRHKANLRKVRGFDSKKKKPLG